jgi:hypothetical protein
MRILAVLLALTLAGCSDPDSPPPGHPSASEAELPKPIHIEAVMPLSWGQTGIDVTGPCSLPTQACHVYPFTLQRAANVTLILQIQSGAYDLDMYVTDSLGNIVLGDPRSAAATEADRGVLDGGSYDILIDGYMAVETSYVLDVAFDEP